MVVVQLNHRLKCIDYSALIVTGFSCHFQISNKAVLAGAANDYHLELRMNTNQEIMSGKNPE